VAFAHLILRKTPGFRDVAVPDYAQREETMARLIGMLAVIVIAATTLGFVIANLGQPGNRDAVQDEGSALTGLLSQIEATRQDMDALKSDLESAKEHLAQRSAPTIVPESLLGSTNAPAPPRPRPLPVLDFAALDAEKAKRFLAEAEAIHRLNADTLRQYASRTAGQSTALREGLRGAADRERDVLSGIAQASAQLDAAIADVDPLAAALGRAQAAGAPLQADMAQQDRGGASAFVLVIALLATAMIAAAGAVLVCRKIAPKA